MITNNKENKLLNKYFREFILANKDYFSENTIESKTITKIAKNESIPFHKSWEYLMVLVQIIEKKWDLKNIETHDNYVRFSTGEFDGFQDKDSTKIEAFYSCCFKTLEKLWKDQKPPFKYDSQEPFDEFDLK